MMKKCSIVAALAVTVLSSALLVSCRKAEAVISEGEDITTQAEERPTLEVSRASTFSYNDLTYGKATFLMTESQVKTALGTPKSVKDVQEDTRIYIYKDVTVTFEKLDDENNADINGTYKVTEIATISEESGNTAFSRGLKVGDTFDDILNAYYRETDYMKRYYKSEDETTVYGVFLYGSFTVAELDKISTKEPVSYGLVNYNGYSSLSQADNYYVEFVYFDGNYKGDRASTDDQFAELIFNIDKSGKIKEISWYYYP